ncbi:hypothetical protein OH77DRAFT_1017669 [Trametes cingulata]|nr:hypothetical protein OH77DRAFT_1017669 [Trametes cingulata]
MTSTAQTSHRPIAHPVHLTGVLLAARVSSAMVRIRDDVCLRRSAPECREHYPECDRSYKRLSRGTGFRCRGPPCPDVLILFSLSICQELTSRVQLPSGRACHLCACPSGA